MFAPIILIVAAVAYTVLNATMMAYGDGLPNFSPFAALIFCSIAVLPKRYAVALPALAWLAIYPVAAMIQGYSWHAGLLPTAVGFTAIALCAMAFRGKRTPLALLGGSLLGAVAFYFITNSFSFFGGMYPMTVEGYYQCMWSGIPGSPFPPTYTFFRNALVSNLLFTSLFVFACSFSKLPLMKLARRRTAAQNP